MSLEFYPSIDEPLRGTMSDRLDSLMEAAERYKAIVLDEKAPIMETPKEKGGEEHRMTPREIKAAFNWDEIAQIMREIREIPESGPDEKKTKAEMLMRLAEIYEVLRAAKMSKLEAVRLALVNEAKQLK